MQKRIISYMVIVSILMATLLGRAGYLMLYSIYTVASGYNSYSLLIDTIEPTLLYSNGERINNNVTSYIAVIKPNEKCIGELNKIFDYKERNEIINELKKGYPITRKIDKFHTTKYIEIYETYSTNCNCSQLISTQSSGIISHLNYQKGTRKINYTIDATGRLLAGDKGQFEYSNYHSQNGLKLTLDKRIQKITYDACKDMRQGCAIVMNTNTSEILACVNKPNSSYINSCFSQYSVGSVFKLVVSICALENNIDLEYSCNGKIKVNDSTFSCQKNKAHKSQDLKQALANSCNCYFVNLAINLGSEKLLDTSKKLGFNTSTRLVNDWDIKNANLPSNELLSSTGQLALFGFGQGALTCSPLQICSVLCTIANGGKYNIPKITQKEINQQQIVSEESANTLLEYMRYVVSNGTGYNAESSAHQSAGKTATAQTGQYKYGIEMLDTWFAGVYPYENPKYAIVIMTENGKSGSEDCCPIFRTIVENL